MSGNRNCLLNRLHLCYESIRKNCRCAISFRHLRSYGLMRSTDSLPNQTSLRDATNHTSEDHYTAVKAWKPLPLSQDALISRLPASAKSSKKFVQVTLLSCIRDVSGSNLDHKTDSPIVFRALPQELQVNERTASHIRHGSCEYGNELSGFIKECLAQLRKYKHNEDDPATHSSNNGWKRKSSSHIDHHTRAKWTIKWKRELNEYLTIHNKRCLITIF